MLYVHSLLIWIWDVPGCQCDACQHARAILDAIDKARQPVPVEFQAPAPPQRTPSRECQYCFGRSLIHQLVQRDGDRQWYHRACLDEIEAQTRRRAVGL